MPEIKHTPGPWFVESTDKTPIYVSPVNRHEQIGICNVMVIDEDESSDSGEWFNGDQTKANAKLIAAAPDLLADLQEAATTLRRYETLHRAKGTDDSTAKAEVNATLAARFEATIAKATE
ncbi:hypothetical protein [Pseudomonas eucalypticola]|uniref:Uncharacterized protein n=1 Tax=Pseudomonas eucalypticola TaxID=2599595 RepID=A0A7D5DAD6_9PSED|nr:hypothetical protein [Pseudomonas eucalypticola]QKZ05875.1 hypothetical protein HWQ56_19620 [Pseudomonas eucalypticola]